MTDNLTPTIGKTILETLTTGMYEDNKFVYREYIQNSADAIDKAVKNRIIKKEEGGIWIEIEKDKKIVTIEDNGIGINYAQSQYSLINIAESNKDIAIDKGFRGIGRLGGLGYCDKVVFETSSKGESIKTIITWDAKSLKEIIADRKTKEEATEVIKKVTSLTKESEDTDKHYFKVRLENVTEQELLDVEKIRQYLSMVAPVPYSAGFPFKDKIYDELKKNDLKIDEYNIYTNQDQIFKLYTKQIYKKEGNTNKKKVIGEIFDIEFFQGKNKNNEILFYGWYGLSKFGGVMDETNPARCIRLRKYNIQIGNEFTLNKFFIEHRGNKYFFGEVFAFHKDLIPNARRDDFTDNNTYQEFSNEIKEIFHTQLYEIYRKASKIRNDYETIEKFNEFEENKKEKDRLGYINAEEKKEYDIKIEKDKQNAINAQKNLEKIKEKINEFKPLEKIFEKITEKKPLSSLMLNSTINNEEENKIKYISHGLSKLNKKERKILDKVFEILRKNLAPPTVDEIIKKIEEEFK
ncbi:MAG: hypothetical protein CVT89_00485 [Candidatus Altiarchaeales archaeon HGW-Altiarchaeales-2]|nr:MAG: hypothetical protein CVT89_00485 [Candidatus Altiarchaeales archaeon HGW-Altiarchaeales-2]